MFCTKCGRQLEEGEVCTCQSEAAQTAENTEAATDAAAQPASKPIITKEQATEISKGLIAYAKDFFKNPVAASESVAEKGDLVTVGGLVAVNAALQLVFDIIYLLINTIKYGKYGNYGVGTWLRVIFAHIVWWIAIPAAFAGLIWLCGKVIEKKEVDFKKALGVFAVPAMPLLIFTVINFLNLILTHSFFDVIFGVLKAGVGGIMIFLTAVGITKVLPKSEKFLYSAAAICAGLWFVDWLVLIAIF